MTTRSSQSVGPSPSERDSLLPPPVLAENGTTTGSNKISAVREFFKHNNGLLIIAASQFFFSLMNLSVKFLSALDDPVPTLEVIAVRMIITYVCCQVYMFAAGVPDPILGPKGIRMWLFIRGMFGFSGLVGLYYSLNYLSLSDMTVLGFLTPTILTATGFLFLREAVSWKQGVAGLASLVGVVSIAKPAFLFGGSDHVDSGVGTGGRTVTQAQRMLAVCVAILGVFGAAGAYTSIRIIGKRAHAMHTMSYFSGLSVLASVILGIAIHDRWVLPHKWTWMGMLIIVGLFGFFAQLLLTFGLQRETVSRGSTVLYIQIVFTLIFDRVIFGVSPSGLGWLGTFIIITSAIYVALNKPSMEINTPANGKPTTTWDGAPASEEGRRLLDGNEQREQPELDGRKSRADELGSGLPR